MSLTWKDKSLDSFCSLDIKRKTSLANTTGYLSIIQIMVDSSGYWWCTNPNGDVFYNGKSKTREEGKVDAVQAVKNILNEGLAQLED